MTKSEIDSIAEGWIRYQLAAEGSSEQAEEWKHVATVLDIRLGMVEGGGAPSVLWQLILAIHSRTASEAVRGVLAAGPLEDLLAYQGEAFIERIEKQAEQDPAFASQPYCPAVIHHV